MNKEEIEEIKRLLFEDRLTQHGKRKLIKYLEYLESKLNKVTDKLKEVGNKYIKEYKDVEKLDLIQQNTAVLQELSCVIDDIEEILNIIEGENHE